MINPDTHIFLPEFVTFTRVDEDLAVISSPLEKHQLRGDSVELIAEVVPLLRNGTSAPEIASKVNVSETTAEQLLRRLFETGLLRLANPENDYFEWATSNPDVAREAAGDATVALLSPTKTVANTAWNAQSFTVTQVDSIAALRNKSLTPDLIISAVNGIRPAFHRALTEYADDMNINWLPSRVVDAEIRIGPLMQPKRGACYNCYYERSLASVEHPVAVTHKQQTDDRQPHYPDSVIRLQHAFTRLEALHIVSGDSKPATEETVLTIDLFTFERSAESVLKLPGCEVCGEN